MASPCLMTGMTTHLRMTMDKGGMRVTHEPDTDNVHKIEIVGDGAGAEGRITTSALRKLANGERDPFKTNPDRLRKLNGLSGTTKRRLSRRLNKIAEGHDGTKSKAVIHDKTVTGYVLFDVEEPPYNLEYLAKLYEISSAHKAAVDAKVINIVGLGYNLKESDKTLERLEELTGESLSRARRKISRNKKRIQAYIDGLNSEDTFYEVLRKVWTDFETTGNGYMEIGRTTNGQVGYIGHVHATTVRRRTEKDGYVQVVGNKAVFFHNYGEAVDSDGNPLTSDNRPNELIHFRKYTPTNSYYGVPDIISAKNAVGGDEFAARFNLDYFEHKAVPRYVITLKGAQLSEKSEQQLVDFLSSSLKGQHHRTIYIPLPPDSEHNKVEFEMEAVESGTIDASFLKYSEQNRDTILMSHRTPLSKTGIVHGVNLAAAKDGAETFKEEVCRPQQLIIEKRLQPLFDDLTDMFDFKLVELTLTDEDTQSKIDERDLRWEVVVPNEVRARKGMKGRPGGDSPVGVMAQAKARASQSRQTQAQANQSRTRDQNRSAQGTDSNNTARSPKGEGRSTE